MKAYDSHRGLAVPLRQSHVDTDQIIPKQFLKSIERSGYGANLFDSWRYQDEGRSDQQHTQRPLNLDFVLNKQRYQGASVLLAGANFGCGSSREHAVWALLDYGFEVVIASSFADIFYNNSCNNGLLAVVLPEAVIERLMDDAETGELHLTIDLNRCTVALDGDAEQWSFAMAEPLRQKLLQGLDDIGLSLREREAIEACEQRRREAEPWIFEVAQEQ